MTESFTVGVTGTAGYIGGRVVQELQAAHPDWEIVAGDNFYKGTTRDVGDVSVQHLDVRDRHALEAVFGDVDVLLHLAAVSGVDDCDDNPELSYETNVVGTTHVARLCHDRGIGLVFPASMAILGDPDAFPIQPGLARDPLNWYARTKVLGETAIEGFAPDRFPAHVLVKSNLYGGYEVDSERVSKGTVINFFVERALAEEPLTVYEPGTQARNFVHVVDVARAYVRSAELLRDQLAAGETGVDHYMIASDEDPSVQAVAETVRAIATEQAGLDPPVTLVENPRSGETTVDRFDVDTSRTHAELGWAPTHLVEETIRSLVDSGVEG
jgi:nucleoside-diphosphate-sugar epimerase